MAVSEAYSGTGTIGTTEYSLVNGSTALASVTDDGVYQLFIDFSNLTNTEVYELKVKEKVTSGGTQRVCVHETISFAQSSEPNYVSGSFILMHGWDFTLKKLSGTDRSISWSIRKG